jgi:hypothetical protein
MMMDFDASLIRVNYNMKKRGEGNYILINIDTLPQIRLDMELNREELA